MEVALPALLTALSAEDVEVRSAAVAAAAALAASPIMAASAKGVAGVPLEAIKTLLFAYGLAVKRIETDAEGAAQLLHHALSQSAAAVPASTVKAKKGKTASEAPDDEDATDASTDDDVEMMDG